MKYFVSYLQKEPPGLLNDIVYEHPFQWVQSQKKGAVALVFFQEISDEDAEFLNEDGELGSDED